KEFQRNGIGKQLFEAVISEFSKCKVSSMILWTLEENPSRYFYEFMGGRIFGNRIIERGGKKLRQIGYVWDDIAGIVRKMQRR
ncbi:MAG: GNAT family N-acetyltransferase, partial [Bacillota bacterium]|nr:GNAT family N-acetyltransferase [Bacillota bacterium]